MAKGLDLLDPCYYLRVLFLRNRTNGVDSHSTDHSPIIANHCRVFIEQLDEVRL